MLRWHSQIYTDVETNSHKEELIKRIKKDKKADGFFCIVLASNEKNLFDIIAVNELQFNHYKKMDLYIVALAKDKQKAMELTADILLKVHDARGDYNVREFFGIRKEPSDI